MLYRILSGVRGLTGLLLLEGTRGLQSTVHVAGSRRCFSHLEKCFRTA